MLIIQFLNLENLYQRLDNKNGFPPCTNWTNGMKAMVARQNRRENRSTQVQWMKTFHQDLDK